MYIVIELQTNNGQTAHIVTTHSQRNEADSKFHAIMSAAAVSNIQKHAATLLTDEGVSLKHDVYEHDTSE